MDAKYDDLIARILEEERQIFPFLDVIFGFLWRRYVHFLGYVKVLFFVYYACKLF